MKRGYYVSRKTSDAKAVHWGITYRTSRGSDIAAGSVTFDLFSHSWDVRTDTGEPCTVGSYPYNVRRMAVTAYEQVHNQPEQGDTR